MDCLLLVAGDAYNIQLLAHTDRELRGQVPWNYVNVQSKETGMPQNLCIFGVK